MTLRVCIEGVNLEKLLREAPRCGVTLRGVKRLGDRRICACIAPGQMKALRALCERFGWEIAELSADGWMRALRFLLRRPALLSSLFLCAILVWLSSQMILAVRIEHAMEHEAQVRGFLSEQGVRPGRWKASFSTDDLGARLNYAVPGLAFAGFYYEGSTLVVDCSGAEMAQRLDLPGEGLDIVAKRDGIVTRITVQSGTPCVAPGDAVCKGQVLILGEERMEGGALQPVRAQGEVTARVWAQGSARISLFERRTEETGHVRRRVTLHSPWHSRVVRDAEPFDSQDVSVQTEPIVGLFVPVWRQIDTFARTIEKKAPRDRAQAASWAQGAAQEIAKKQCPYGALILDKTVDYSMIDNEFLYATVVLEYEAPIAQRID